MRVKPKKFFNAPQVSGKAGASFTTFDPATLQANEALSNGNLTVTSSATVNQMVRTIANHSSGKYYCELTTTVGGHVGLGVVNASQSMADWIGDTGNAAGAWTGGWLGGVSGTTTCPTIGTAGHVYGLAVDLTNRAAWIKDITAAGNWNANGTADPASNVNGCTLASGMASGAAYVAVTVGNNGDTITANFGATAYSGTPPTGFGNW